MKRWEAWSVHASTLLVAGTGLLYLWARYLATPVDPYAVARSPVQPLFQHLHVLVAPLLVFAVGIIWREHVWGHFRRDMPARRRSGIALLLALAPMVLSGYLLQTTVEDSWRRAWVIVHLATSAIFVLGYGAHAVGALRVWLRRRRRASTVRDSLVRPA